MVKDFQPDIIFRDMNASDPPGFHRVQPPGKGSIFYVYKPTMRRLFNRPQVSEYLSENNISGVDVEVSGFGTCK